MTPARWRQITEIFHNALAHPDSERARVLQQACAGDDSLHAEVRAMLAAHNTAGTSREVPEVAAGDVLALDTGDTIGPYTVEGLLGAGGMGRVYRARDPRLDREVAIKVLPTLLSADADRLRRFEQEARAAGALTHPNLLTVHDVGTADARPYLVTELVDGETLRDRLSRGATTIVRACEVAAAIARGLAAAHAKGVVHRDLKPENVMITRDGRVKILDFGVAKLGTGVHSGSLTPDASHPHTESGVLVGTAGYMAPEQVRGLETDGRADVFALGAILFEMLTGRRAFDCESREDTFEATLHHDPLATTSVAGQWPPALARTVQRCLEKDPEARFQSAADLAFALESMAGSHVPLHTTDRPVTRHTALLVTAAMLLLAIGAGVATIWNAPEPPATSDALARFPLPLATGMRFVGAPAISPDGTAIVYPASGGPAAAQQLFVRRIDQVTTVALPGTEGADSPFFSPDGQSVAFWADDQLKRTKIDATASPVILCATEPILGGVWTADDTIVFASNHSGLRQLPASGGLPQAVMDPDPTRPEADHHSPAMLPGGRSLLITVHEGERRFRIDVLTPASGAQRTVIANGFDARYVATGHLVYRAGTALLAAPFDLDTMSVSGSSVQLLDGFSPDQYNGIGHYALADSGTLVFRPLVPPARRTIAWVDRSGRTTPVAVEPRAFWTPRLSPDNRQFAVVALEGDTRHIWVHRFETGTFSRVTSEGSNWAPLWSRDGSHLFYATERNGHWLLMRQRVDANEAPEVLVKSAHEELVPGGLSADNRTLIYVSRSSTGVTQLRLLEIAGRRSTTVQDVPPNIGMPVASPDARWLGFTAWSTTRPSIFVRPFGETGPARLLIEAAGYTVWGHNGDRVYYRSRRGGTESTGDGIFEVRFDPVRGVPTGPETLLFRKAFIDWMGVPGFDVSRDGRFLLVLSDERESLPRDLAVVLHVDDELRRRVVGQRPRP